MRTGLFVAGTAVLIIGVGVLVASLTFSTGPPVNRFDPISVSSLGGHSYYTPQLEGSNESSAETRLVWASSGSVLVSVYPSVPCPSSPKSPCAAGHPLQSWWADSGSWSAGGGLSFPLFLNITNPNGTPVTFSGSLTETYTTSALSDPTWAFFIPLLGAVVLIAIGGVGVFLGLFLPEGTYSGRAAPPADYDLAEGDDFDIEDDELEPAEDDADEAPPRTPT